MRNDDADLGIAVDEGFDAAQVSLLAILMHEVLDLVAHVHRSLRQVGLVVGRIVPRRVGVNPPKVSHKLLHAKKIQKNSKNSKKKTRT
jgi:hypothetical protein